MTPVFTKIYDAFPKNFHAYMVDYLDDKLFALQRKIFKIGANLHGTEQNPTSLNLKGKAVIDHSPKRRQSILDFFVHFRSKANDLLPFFNPIDQRRPFAFDPKMSKGLSGGCIRVEAKTNRQIEEYCKLRTEAQKKAGIDVKEKIFKALRYTVSQIALFFLIPCLWIFDFGRWLAGNFHEEHNEKITRKELRGLVEAEDHKKIMAFFYKTLNKLRHPKSAAERRFIVDLLAIKEIHRNIHHLLRGANCVFLDKGRLFQRWKQLEGACIRASSHDHLPEHCRAFRSKLFKETLFWLDRKGNTRLQLEKSPLTGPIFGIENKLRHLVDFFRYFRDGLQKGPYGVSDKVETHPLIIPIDFKRFKKRVKHINS